MYHDLRGRETRSNQFSVTEHFRRQDADMGLNTPGVFFFYEMSAIKVAPSDCCAPAARRSVDAWLQLPAACLLHASAAS